MRGSGEYQKEKRKENKLHILKLLNGSGKAWDEREIARALGIKNRTNLRKVLAESFKEGKVVRVGFDTPEKYQEGKKFFTESQKQVNEAIESVKKLTVKYIKYKVDLLWEEGLDGQNIYNQIISEWRKLPNRRLPNRKEFRKHLLIAEQIISLKDVKLLVKDYLEVQYHEKIA